MSYSDFADELLITDKYLAQLQAHFEEVMGARHVRTLNHQVCIQNLCVYIYLPEH